MKKWLSRFAKFPVAITVFTLLLCYGSCYIHPEQYGYLSVFGLFYPIVLAFSIIILIVYLFIKPMYAVVIILAIGLGLPWWPVYFSLGNNGDVPENNTSLVSYNAQGFTAKNSKGYYSFSEKELKSWVDQKDIRDADIIIVQESPHGQGDELIQALDRKNNTLKKSPRISLHSDHTFVDIYKKGVDKNTTNGIYETEFIFSTDTLRLISVHLQSNRLRSKDIDEINSGAWTGRNKYTSLWHSIQSYKAHAIDRAQQVQLILDRVERSPYPVIVVGDFNDVPMSYVSQQMRSKLNDAYSVSGRGLSTTLKSLSGLKIDYIYASKSLDIHDCHVIRVGASDHYPLRAVWSFKD